MRRFEGIGAAPGVAVGRALVIRSSQPEKVLQRAFLGKERETVLLERALAQFRTVTEGLAVRLDEQGGDGDILRGHIRMTEDPFMIAGMKECIEKGQNAAVAAASMCDMFISVFERAEEELTRQRAADVRDVKNRLLRIMSGETEQDVSALSSKTVLILEELTPSMTAVMDRVNTVGVVTCKGGRTSHAAILARAMGLPAVLGVRDALTEIESGITVGIDGVKGELYISPDDAMLAVFEARIKADAAEKARLAGYRGKVTMTADGIKKDLLCNIGTEAEIPFVLENDGEGVGLFRTEFLFMDKAAAPDEEEQFRIYRAAAVALGGRPLIIRTLDVGGDKSISYLHFEAEENPFLGHRGLRFCLENAAFWGAQLRAILRASAFGNIRILLPMVTCVEELRAARRLIAEAGATLAARGEPYHAHVPVGVMIETPAACMIAELLAKETDFFSIGTNDLTQYIMAADRGNSKTAHLNSVYHPAVLRALREVIVKGRAAGIPVGMCGESAADPLMTPLFLAFGLSEFSVNVGSLLKLRAEISQWSFEKAKRVADHALMLDCAAAVEEYLKGMRIAPITV